MSPMTVALAYDPLPDDDLPERVRIEARGSHRVAVYCKDELIAAMHELKPPKGARLVVLDTAVHDLPDSERAALLCRIGFVAAQGGLISSLNGWENISLPTAYHQPARVPELLPEIQALLEALGGVDDNLLAKLPEDMTLYEKRLVAYLRAMLGKPDLLLVENLAAGLGPTKRRRTTRFAEVYHQSCPQGTFIQIDEGRHHD